MGVLNVTPDSFSGDGFTGEPREAARRAERAALDGADIIDIGGESTRPGYSPVDVAEELRRALPAVQAARQAVDIPISIDTTKVAVAEAALAAGASIVNDVSGGMDLDMTALVAEHGAALIVVHHGRADTSRDLVAAVISDLERMTNRAINAGVPPSRLVVDPGLGFGKTWKENFEIMRRFPEVKSLGLPVLVGPSRKGMIGKVLGVPVTDRVEGTLALVALAAVAGADIVRVHDVREMSRAVRMIGALRESDS
jgi:dihydropteroate synthase